MSINADVLNNNLQTESCSVYKGFHTVPKWDLLQECKVSLKFEMS